MSFRKVFATAWQPGISNNSYTASYPRPSRCDSRRVAGCLKSNALLSVCCVLSGLDDMLQPCDVMLRTHVCDALRETWLSRTKPARACVRERRSDLGSGSKTGAHGSTASSATAHVGPDKAQCV
eukprot:1555544-Rhodomonas_salina.1